MLYVLTRPFAFIAVKHAGLQAAIFGIPVIVGLLFTVAYYHLPVAPNLVGDKGVVSGLLGAASILPGFFFAALAAISTADRPLLDKAMPDPAPKLSFESGGKRTDLNLTFRVFLSFLFSYVTVLSFVLLIIIVSSDLIEPSLKKILIENELKSMLVYLKNIYVFMVSAIVTQLAVCATIGLYFLTERMHRP